MFPAVGCVARPKQRIVCKVFRSKWEKSKRSERIRVRGVANELCLLTHGAHAEALRLCCSASRFFVLLLLLLWPEDSRGCSKNCKDSTALCFFRAFPCFSDAKEFMKSTKVQAHQLGSFHWAPSPKPAMHMEHLGSIPNRRMGVKLCKETAILHQPFEFAPYWEHQAQEMVFQAPATETCLCCTTKHQSVSTIVSLMVWWKSSIQTHAHNSAQLVDL